MDIVEDFKRAVVLSELANVPLTLTMTQAKALSDRISVLEAYSRLTLAQYHRYLAEMQFWRDACAAHIGRSELSALLSESMRIGEEAANEC